MGKEKKNRGSMKLEKFYMKTRDKHYSECDAKALGIRRIYNQTSDMDYMASSDVKDWCGNLYKPSKGESVIVESALREVNGVNLYVTSCIVFYNVESCNLYFIRHRKSFQMLDGFGHLFN